MLCAAARSEQLPLERGSALSNVRISRNGSATPNPEALAQQNGSCCRQMPGQDVGYAARDEGARAVRKQCWRLIWTAGGNALAELNELFGIPSAKARAWPNLCRSPCLSSNIFLLGKTLCCVSLSLTISHGY